MLDHSSLRVRLGVVAMVASASLVSSAGSAAAAELTDVDIDVTVTPTVADPGDRIRTDVEFCVPDSAMGGDTFTVSLAEQLTQLPSSIILRDPASEVVAIAEISGTPAVATFTLTDYVNDRIDVCGRAYFESQLRSDLTPESQQTLSFVVGGGATFDIVVDVGTPDVGTDRSEPRKSAAFSDPGDQCRTVTTSCINWFIESLPGPFASVTIVDDGLVDASFECSTLSVTLWSLLPDGSRDARVTPADGTVSSSCTPDSLSVEVTDVPADLIVRTLISATPDLPDPDGDTRYENVAAVTHVDLTEGTITDEVGGSARSSAAGGEASGVLPPPTSTTTTTTTTSTTTTTTTPPGSGAATTTTTVLDTVTTTTFPGSGAATTTTIPVTLPPTGGGEEGAGALVATLLIGAGVALLTASRRRAAND